MEDKKEKSYLTLEEVAELLGVNYQLIYRLVRDGKLPAIRLGRIYRIDRADLTDYLALMKQRTGDDDAGECAACGQAYRSKSSLRQACEQCGQPICVDCWTRRKIHRCPTHTSTPQSE